MLLFICFIIRRVCQYVVSASFFFGFSPSLYFLTGCVVACVLSCWAIPLHRTQEIVTAAAEPPHIVCTERNKSRQAKPCWASPTSQHADPLNNLFSSVARGVPRTRPCWADGHGSSMRSLWIILSKDTCYILLWSILFKFKAFSEVKEKGVFNHKLSGFLMKTWKQCIISLLLIRFTRVQLRRINTCCRLPSTRISVLLLDSFRIIRKEIDRIPFLPSCSRWDAWAASQGKK